MQIKLSAFSSLAVTAGLLLAHPGIASATAVLSYQDLGQSVTSTSGPTGQGTTYSTLPASDTYGNTFLCQSSGSCGSSVLVASGGNNYNFYDDFEFTVAASTVDAVSSTIDLQNLLQIDNLQMRVYSTTGNSSLPVLGTPVGMMHGWSAPVSFSAGSESGEVAPLSGVMLDAGTYVLEVRGDVVGTSGGSYSGTLNLSPVPLPAALPLLLSGLGVLGGIIRKRITA